MLQVNHLRDNRNLAIERLTKRNFDASELVDKAIALDTDRKSTQADLDNTLANSNKVAKAIGDLFKSGKIEEANVAKAEADRKSVV